MTNITIPIPRGAAAQSIAAHLCGIGKQTGVYPHDAGDFGRCEAFLTKQPHLRGEINRMAEVNAYWAALVPAWIALAELSDDLRTEAIRGIIAPIQEADPSHMPFGTDAHITLCPITFQAPPTANPDSQIAAAVKAAHQAHREAAGKPPMKPDPTFDTASNNAYNVTADELRQFIERYEQLVVEKADIVAQQAEVMAEAEGRGYATKIIRQIVALRKRKPDDVAEEQAVLDVYKSALGME